MDRDFCASVEQCTAWLRSSDEPLCVRVLLRDKGVDPETALVADMFSDDSSLEFGLVVTHDRRVFQFDFDYLYRPVEEGVFTAWVELTDHYKTTPYVKRIDAALQMLAER
jgi:hypothetical protein